MCAIRVSAKIYCLCDECRSYFVARCSDDVKISPRIFMITKPLTKESFISETVPDNDVSIPWSVSVLIFDIISKIGSNETIYFN